MILVPIFIDPKPEYMEYGGLVWRWVAVNFLFPSVGYW